MSKRLVRSLVILNVTLAVALAGVLIHRGMQPAQAQFGGAGGQYTMVAGDINGRTQQGVYIFELNSGRLVSLLFNGARREFEVIDGRDVRSDINRVQNAR